MLNNTGLSKNHWEIIYSIFSDFPEVEQKILFGSRAKGNYKMFSDIDFAIDGKTVNYQTIAAIKDLFTESLLPFFVDLVLLSKISSKELTYHIVKYGKNIDAIIPLHSSPLQPMSQNILKKKFQ